MRDACPVEILHGESRASVSRTGDSARATGCWPAGRRCSEVERQRPSRQHRRPAGATARATEDPEPGSVTKALEPLQDFNRARRALIFIVAALFIPGTAGAGRIYIDIGYPGRKPFPLALPDPIPLDGKKERAAEVRAAIEADLDYTGLFQLLDPGSFLGDPGKEGLERSRINFRNWLTIGAEALVKIGCRDRGKELALDLAVYDVATTQAILDRKYTAASDQVRRIAHAAADDIVESLTGEKGIFSSRIAMTGKTRRGKEVFVMDLDGAGLRPLTSAGSIILSPRWSPDGRRISYTAFVRGIPSLHLIDVASGAIRLISQRPGLNTSAAWSPDGKILAVTLSKDGNAEIYLIQEDGSILKRLTSNFWIDTSPAWSPGGERLAFVSAKSGAPQIYVMDRNGENVQRLTYAGMHNESPAWSPRSDAIAFTGRDEGFFDVFIMNPDGGNIRRLTTLGTGNNEHPSWSPDGRQITFSSNRDGHSRIYVMNSDGTRQRPITPPGQDFIEPDWSPRQR